MQSSDVAAAAQEPGENQKHEQACMHPRLPAPPVPLPFTTPFHPPIVHSHDSLNTKPPIVACWRPMKRFLLSHVHSLLLLRTATPLRSVPTPVDCLLSPVALLVHVPAPSSGLRALRRLDDVNP